ncbi:uncharacterized protein BDCG_17149 [Blastomyces dermatitidis ER-3]|uniref:Uncharacterized protein n=1 Tax=Ajellomyces dermatitidis (strain ER-3 / ATCC MYA-2586) TaxID=559297 RepID=A0ABX2VWP4_AJEDR|nr:uncharacterized protein BDCG_17149 [Blastomyces dermatitidis ER-3]OAT01589.1 hypothetical protein BDCG_17149 [Blastomyces dermatitidis ER-3]
MKIELLEVTVSETKLFSGSSLNDHTGSYATVLAGGGGSVAIVVRGAENRLDMDELISRRDDISLQGMVTITAAVKEAGEEGDVTMRVMLSQLIDTAVSTSNLAFLAAMKAAAAP